MYSQRAAKARGGSTEPGDLSPAATDAARTRTAPLLLRTENLPTRNAVDQAADLQSALAKLGTMPGRNPGYTGRACAEHTVGWGTLDKQGEHGEMAHMRTSGGDECCAFDNRGAAAGGGLAEESVPLASRGYRPDRIDRCTGGATTEKNALSRRPRQEGNDTPGSGGCETRKVQHVREDERARRASDGVGRSELPPNQGGCRFQVVGERALPDHDHRHPPAPTDANINTELLLLEPDRNDSRSARLIRTSHRVSRRCIGLSI